MRWLQVCPVDDVRPVTRLAVFTGCLAVAAFAADAPPGRVFAHVPDVPDPARETPADYRAAITASATRYRELYTAAELTEALAEARNGLALAVQAGDVREEAEFLKAALYVSWLLGETESGLDYGQRLLVRADEFNDDRMRSLGHRVIGSIFRALGNRDQERSHFELAFTLAERAGDANLRIAALNNLGNLALDDGDVALARRRHEEVLAYREKNGLRWDAAGSLTNLADVAEKTGDLTNALSLQERALAIRIELDDRRGQVRSLWQVASLLRQLGRTDEALVRLTDAKVRAEKIGGHELLGQVYENLARVHEARQDFAAALAAERLVAREREALAGDRARIHAENLTARYELVQKQHTIASLAREQQLQAAELRARDADLERARWQRYGLAGALVLGVLAVGALLSRQRLKLRAERDILLETRAAKEAAEEADRVKTRFLGIASHDIRTPLGNIVYLSNELRQSPSAAQRGECLDTITSEAQRVLSLVEELLTIAALETGKLELNRAPLDLAAVAHAAVDSLRWQATAKRQTIDLLPPPAGAPAMVGDAARLHQVVTNLVSNAIKFSPPGQPITVAFTRAGDTLTLSVRDQGAGLSAADAAKLFTPFTRLSAHPTAGESSHGLGLAIAHEIVRLHGGAIRVESQPGAGATFYVELPAPPLSSV